MAAKIRVTAIQRLCVNDGPGVRTVVFLKGCYLECPWCCNPESIHFDSDSFFDKGLCKFPAENAICRNCELHGGDSLKGHCPINSFEKTYTDYDVDELYNLLMRDKNLYQDGGGVTFSGGEPLLQAFALKPLLQLLKDHDVHIAFETTLYAPVENYKVTRDYVDYWIVDLKYQYGYIANRDYAIDIKDFTSDIRDLQGCGKPILYRMVIMNEILCKTDCIIDQLKENQINRIELLACHSLAENKYKELGKRFHRFKTPSNEILKSMCEIMKLNGIAAKFVTI